ncbi:MAG: hypothetical protein HWD58_20305 [Bacteroidota bacterium]|nr:MAG: hypothetical protein HWD58_20305 [Bacteroidota bacterium]
MKSNQLESEFDPMYDYLPVIDNLWGKHCVRLDETQDAYEIVVIEHNEQLKFIWKGWRAPCPQNEIGKLYNLNVEYDNFLSTIEECLTFLITTYPDVNIGLK